MKALGKFLEIIVGVKLGPQVDVALSALERAEIFPHVFRIRSALDHRRDHEGRVHDLSKAELLCEIIRAAEERRRRHLTVAVE
jgi:hypothetical protein